MEAAHQGLVDPGLGEVEARQVPVGREASHLHLVRGGADLPLGRLRRQQFAHHLLRGEIAVAGLGQQFRPALGHAVQLRAEPLSSNSPGRLGLRGARGAQNGQTKKLPERFRRPNSLDGSIRASEVLAPPPAPGGSEPACHKNSREGSPPRPFRRTPAQRRPCRAGQRSGSNIRRTRLPRRGLESPPPLPSSRGVGFRRRTQPLRG